MTALAGLVAEEGTGTPVAGAALRAYRTWLWLGRGLKAYVGPDTTSALVGSLDGGSYPALEVRPGPAKASDYVRVSSHQLPQGQGWVCSRWRATHYALLYDEQIPSVHATTAADGTFDVDVADTDPAEQLYRLRISHEGHRDGESVRGYAALEFQTGLEPLAGAVPEARLVDLLHHFTGWFYAPLKDPRDPAKGRFVPQYPYDIGISVTLEKNHPARTTYDDCCSFVEALLVRGWLDGAVPGFSWNLFRHRRAMIADPAEPFSSVEVLEDAGIAVSVDPDELPPPWTAVQVWRTVRLQDPVTKQPVAVDLGHTLLVVDTHRETGRLLTLECNHAFGLNGPGMRCLGGVDAFLGTYFRCPNDGYVYDPAVGDPPHGVEPGTPFEVPAGPWSRGPDPVPSDWMCPVDGTVKALFVPFCRPPRQWWKSTTVPTWDAFKLTYPRRRLARLKLWELTWMR